MPYLPVAWKTLRGLRSVLDGYDSRFMIAEAYQPVPECVKYYGNDTNECHLPFNFELIECPCTVDDLRRTIVRYEKLVPEDLWRNWVVGNHDQERVASRARQERARIMQMLLFTLPGTLTCYYGDELGMTNGEIAPDEVRDPMALNEPGAAKTRDVARTPMLWDESPGAGFTSGRPWLPVSSGHKGLSVEAQLRDPISFLRLFKELLYLRKYSGALLSGRIDMCGEDGQILAYTRESETESFLVALNFSGQTRSFSFREWEGEIVLSTLLDRAREAFTGDLELRAYEGVVVRSRSQTSSP